MTKVHREADIEIPVEDSSTSPAYYKDGTPNLEYNSQNDGSYYKDSSSSDVTTYGNTKSPQPMSSATRRRYPSR